MTTYATGKYSVAQCGRCGLMFKYAELVDDGQIKRLRVCRECFDIQHPQENPARISDPIALRRPSPESIADPSQLIVYPLPDISTGINFGQQLAQFAISRPINRVQLGSIQFASATYTVSEGTASVNITVTRTGGSSGAASVNYATSNGTATAGVDYTATSGTLNWADGDVATKSFPIAILDDFLPEAAKTVNVTLSAPTGAGLGTAAAVLTINDTDAPGTLQFSSATYNVTEGNVATITVTRTGGTTGPASVQYATSNGTATQPGDYTAASGTLNWTDGDSADKTFNVTTIADVSVESSETVNLALSSATGATLGSPSAAVLTIQDASYASAATDYNGTTNYAFTSSGLTGATNTKEFVICGRFRVDGGDGSSRTISTAANGGPVLTLSTTNKLTLAINDVTNAINIVFMASATAYVAGATWHDYVIVGKMDSPNTTKMYVDNVLEASLNPLDVTLKGATAGFSVGGTAGGTAKFDGCLSQLIYDPVYHIADATFLSAWGAGAAAKQLGANAETLLGHSALFYAENGDPSVRDAAIAFQGVKTSCSTAP